jgi:hypothetical protein
VEPLAALASFLSHALAGEEEAAMAARTPEMEQDISNEWLWHVVAGAYSLLNHGDGALRALRAAVRLGFINYPKLSSDAAFLDCLGDDPGYRALLAEVEPRWRAVVDWESRTVL